MTNTKARRAFMAWRKREGKSLHDVAEMLGRSRSMVHHFEKGRRQLSLEDRIKLSDLTGIPLGSWLTKEERATLSRLIVRL